jgi:hypothetical protein
MILGVRRVAQDPRPIIVKHTLSMNEAVGLSFGSFLKQSEMKSWNEGEKEELSVGLGSSKTRGTISKEDENVSVAYGNFAVAISIIDSPKLQISETYTDE